MQQAMPKETQALAAFWSKGAKAYLKYQEIIAPLSRHITGLVGKTNPPEELRILDIACGAGEPSITLAETFPKAHITATDVAEGMVETAKEAAAARNVTRIEWAVVDAQDLSAFQTSSVDVVTCVAGLFMMPEPRQVLREFRRVLKPNGQALVTVWGRPEEVMFATSTFLTLQKLLGETGPLAMNRHKDLDLSDPKQFQALFPEGGFSKAEVSEFNFSWTYSPEQIREMGGHPMFGMIRGALIKHEKAKDEDEALELFFEQYFKDIKETGYIHEDGIAYFPSNKALVVHAFA